MTRNEKIYYALCLLNPVGALLGFCLAFRGASHAWGDTVNRIISWGIPIGLLSAAVAWAHGMPCWLGLPCGLAAFGMACIGNSTEEQDTKASHRRMAVLDSLMLLAQILPFLTWAAAANAQLDASFILVLGLGQFGYLAYDLGYRRQVTFRLFGRDWATPGDNVTCGELYNGYLAFGSAYAVLLLTGYKIIEVLHVIF